MPPPRKNPAKTRDLEVQQRGMELLLVMGYPSTTIGGLALPGIDQVRFQQYTRLAPEFSAEALAAAASTADESVSLEQAEAAESAALEEKVREEAELKVEALDTPALEAEELEARDFDTADPLEGEEAKEFEAAESEEEEVASEEANPYLRILVDPDQFRKNAQEVLVLEGDALDAAVVGGHIVTRVPLDDVPTEPPVAHSFGARTYAGRIGSPESNLASIVPLPPPSPPADVRVAAEPSGIQLSWAGVTGEEDIEGYRIYRRAPLATLYGEPISTTEPDETEFLDRTARFGSKYVYAVSTMKMKAPLVESRLSDETEIAYADDFPPAAPTGLVILAEVGSTRLVWEVSPARDVVGYLVFSSLNGGEPVQLTPEPVAANEYIHAGTQSGATYSYTVVSIDSSGNRSKPSEAVSSRAP